MNGTLGLSNARISNGGQIRGEAHEGANIIISGYAIFDYQSLMVGRVTMKSMASVTVSSTANVEVCCLPI
jgi:hypothetical protein